MTVKSIVALLSKHHQRATYGAVAGVLGKAPRSVMQGYPRNWLHSWVVSEEDGRPSGYPEPMIDHHLEERSHILRTPQELAAWLANPA